MTSVLAVDPGEQTGYAVFEWDRDENTYRILRYNHRPWAEFARALHDGDPFDIIVYESWRLRRENALELAGSDMQSSQCIGALRLCGWVWDSVLIEQPPRIKPFIDQRMTGSPDGDPNDYLPERSGVEHHRDALRHGHYYLTIKKEATWIRDDSTS